MADQTVLALAQMLSGEVSGQPYETKVRVASTALNRLSANNPKEFGSSMPEVLQKGYYAVSNPNTPYKQAVSGNFPDEASQNDFKTEPRYRRGTC